MAQYRGTVKGSRGMASRLGTKKTGIEAHICGWDTGVRVYVRWNEEECEDEVLVFRTGGSNDVHNSQLIAKWTEGSSAVVTAAAQVKGVL